LQVAVAESVIAGIVEGCRQAGCALVGGETAEMPGMYHGGDYDLAGFCVGVVERDAIIDGSKVKAGDAVIGMASSGPHSNGYSLIRRLVALKNADASTMVDGQALFDRLLAPTRIYVPSMLALGRALSVHGFAHITGGGLTDNIPRVLPEDCGVTLQRSAWHRDPVFEWLQAAGGVADAEMHRTFNCGIGMVAIVDRNDADRALAVLKAQGERATLIGEVRRGQGDVSIA
jgi:phosphoribosylformylglycinamidine cyclo-ligase